jgi:hypothetical protein
MDLESAVAAAWRTTAEQMPGVRMVTDRCLEAPQGAEMEQVMRRARDHEWARLATAAGLANTQDAAAVEVGRRVEEQARVALAVSLVLADVEPTGEAAVEPAGSGPGSTSFVDRIKAVIAA